MRVTVFSDFRAALNAAGMVCTHNGPRRYDFWARYLDVFEQVTVVSRLNGGTNEGFQVTGPNVSYHPVPDYSGAAHYLRNFPAIRRAVLAACHTDSAFILRLPGRLGVMAGMELLRIGKSYGVEIGGNPIDVFAPGVVQHPLRPILRRVFASDLRYLAQHAAAASYVTEHALQRAFPCPAFEIGVAGVDLGADAIAATWKRARLARPLRIVTVGSLAQLYKGPDVLLHALATCVRQGIDASLVLVGDGRYRTQLEITAAELGLSDRTSFRGRVPAGAAVRAELDAADLFVLPSRAEGLPRALVEAMARGLPCLASRIGGIPELLAEEDLVTVGDSAELARQIAAVYRNPKRRERMAARNLERARDFSEPLLRARRRQFYERVFERARAAHARPALLPG